MNAMKRLRELKEKAKREGLTEDENAELRRVIHQWRLESDFAMLEKQVRMLVKLAERSPVVKGKLTQEIVTALEPGTEYVMVERQQMKVLLVSCNTGSQHKSGWDITMGEVSGVANKIHRSFASLRMTHRFVL